MEDLLALPKEELVAKLKKIKEQVTRWAAHRWPQPPHAAHGSPFLRAYRPTMSAGGPMVSQRS